MSDAKEWTLTDYAADAEKKLYANMAALDMIEDELHRESTRQWFVLSGPYGVSFLKTAAKALRLRGEIDPGYETDEWYWQPEWRD